MGRGQRREALRGPHGQLPRQRRRRVVLRQPQGRDVPPGELRDPSGGPRRRGRLRRGLIQPPAPALDGGLPDSGRAHGRVLRPCGAGVRAGGRGGAAGSVITPDRVSEILNQFSGESEQAGAAGLNDPRLDVGGREP